MTIGEYRQLSYAKVNNTPASRAIPAIIPIDHRYSWMKVAVRLGGCTTVGVVDGCDGLLKVGSRPLHLSRCDCQGFRRLRNGGLQELLPQTFIDFRRDNLRLDSAGDFLWQGVKAGNGVFQGVAASCQCLAKRLPFRRQSRWGCVNQERQKLHYPQDAKHLVVFGQRTAMAEFAVVVCPHVHRKSLGDAIHEVLFVDACGLDNLAHGNSNSFTLSNSASIRRR